MRPWNRTDPTGRAAWEELGRAIRSLPPPTRPSSPMDEPVERYFRHALVEAAVAPGVRLTMRGRIRIQRWLPFRAKQLLVPQRGSVWRARVAGVISGSDRSVGGEGAMDWRLLKAIRLVHAFGPDVARSAAERAAGESIWAPAAMWPSQAVRWRAIDDTGIEASVDVDGHPVTLLHRIDATGRLVASSYERWGDPDSTGCWARHPFGVEITGERTFDGVTIPSRGRAGWHFGTDRWADGVFFEFEITGCALVT